MTTVVKRFNRYTARLLIVLGFCFVLFGLLNGAVCQAEDTTPPYLVNPIPEPGTVTENWFFIKTGIVDDLTGVNGDSIIVTINGAPPRVKPIIEQSYSNKGYDVTLVLSASEKSEEIVVEVQAKDLAGQPNLLVDQWSFYVETIMADRVLVNMYPENHRNLSFDSESGKLNFSWAAMQDYKHYRMEFKLRDGSAGTMDVTLDGERISDSYYRVSYELEGLSVDSWQALVDAGEINWRVAPLNKPDGDILVRYGKYDSVTYVGENVPLLRKPLHHALLTPEYPPNIKWEAVTSPLNGYLVVFVKLDADGNYTSEYHVIETTLFIREFDMQPETWNKFSSGVWAWTSLGVFPNGQVTNFSIQRFRKE